MIQRTDDHPGPVVHVRVMTSDRHRRAVLRTGHVTPYVVDLIAEEVERTRPGAWVEMTVPPDTSADDARRLAARFDRVRRSGVEVVVRRADDRVELQSLAG
jgi:hypothetical protein